MLRSRGADVSFTVWLSMPTISLPILRTSCVGSLYAERIRSAGLLSRTVFMRTSERASEAERERD